jgi:transcription elongation factor Elf1
MDSVGLVIGIFMFMLPCLIAAVIFSKVKKYNFFKLFCGMVIICLITAVIVVALIWFFTGGELNTKHNGIVSILPLAMFIGVSAGWGVSLCLTLFEIEKAGKEGINVKEIIRNRDLVLIIRLLLALLWLLFGHILKLIYKWAKKPAGTVSINKPLHTEKNTKTAGTCCMCGKTLSHNPNSTQKLDEVARFCKKCGTNICVSCLQKIQKQPGMVTCPVCKQESFFELNPQFRPQ